MFPSATTSSGDKRWRSAYVAGANATPENVPASEIPHPIRDFITGHIRTVEQLEILLLVSRQPDVVWSIQSVYDAILSTPQSVERWLEELARAGLIEKMTGPPAGYRPGADENLHAEIASLDQLYKAAPVRVIEAIYKRDAGAAQSFADAFKIKKPDKSS